LVQTSYRIDCLTHLGDAAERLVQNNDCVVCQASLEHRPGDGHPAALATGQLAYRFRPDAPIETDGSQLILRSAPRHRPGSDQAKIGDGGQLPGQPIVLEDGGDRAINAGQATAVWLDQTHHQA
jgi:hypothetical protein